jgi:hypothetical protein
LADKRAGRKREQGQAANGNGDLVASLSNARLPLLQGGLAALPAGVGAQRADNHRLGGDLGRPGGGFRRRSPPRPGLIAAAQTRGGI